MTTGPDYATEFISLRPPDNSRSTIELLELERKNGYSDMTDEEISRLIEYKVNEAKRSTLIEEQRKHNEAALEQMAEDAELQRQQTHEFFNQVINMEPALVSVTGNEVD